MSALFVGSYRLDQAALRTAQFHPNEEEQPLESPHEQPLWAQVAQSQTNEAD